MTILDVSFYQGPVSASAFASMTGIERVILKAGGSNIGHQYTDSQYVGNATAARAAGKRLGHYWFNGMGDPAADADFFVDSLTAQEADDWLVLDIESEGSMPHWTPAQVLAFAQRVKARTGKTIGVYMSSSVTSQANWAPVVAFGCWLWVAQYGGSHVTVSWWPGYVAWQYTSSGHVPGIGGVVDLSVPGTINPPNVNPVTQPTKPKDPDMSAVIIPVAGSTEIDLFSVDTGRYVQIESPYHVTLLRRYLNNDGTDKLLRAELDICDAYLRTVNPTAAPVDVAALAAQIKLPPVTIPPIDLTISGKAVSA